MTNREKNDIGYSKIYRSRVCRVAVLLALGLCVAGMCAVAEDDTVLEPQTEFAVQSVEAIGTAQVDTQQAADEEQIVADMGDMAETGIADVPVIFADEEEVGEEKAEILPEDTEVTTGDAFPEISVEMIQVADNKVDDGSDPSESEAKTAGNETPGEENADAELSGECGAQPGTVYWSLDEAGILTITGNGPMADWESVEQTPWFSELATLRAVVIVQGVTSVGTHAFSGAQTVESVELAESVEYIGAFAFFQCGGFGSVTIG